MKFQTLCVATWLVVNKNGAKGNLLFILYAVYDLLFFYKLKTDACAMHVK